MEGPNYSRIMADCKAADLVGRSTELERLVDFALGRGKGGPLIVTGAPGAGVTELLHHGYDRLFARGSGVIPFYFSLDCPGENTEKIARRFLHQFLLQTVAFRRRDPAILKWFPDLCELSEIALPSDGHWIDRAVHAASSEFTEETEEIFLAACIGAPVRAAAAGAVACVMIDDCHAALYSEFSAAVLNAIKAACVESGIPYVLAARRRFDLGLPDSRRMNADHLGFEGAAQLVSQNARASGIAINDETRDLLANQLSGHPGFVRHMFRTAAEQGIGLDSFVNVEKVYAHEIFGGRIRRVLDGVLDRIAPDHELQRSIVSLLDATSTPGAKQLSLESWLKRTAVGEAAFSKMIGQLNVEEFVRLTDGRVEPMTNDTVLSDYIALRFCLEVAGEQRAALYGRSVAAYLKRAPRIMAKYYRRTAAIGLRDLLSSFSLQEVPPAAFDYGLFAEHYKGLPDEEVLTGLRADEASVRLPQIVYTADAADLYKPIGDLVDNDRSAIALGFQEGKYSDEDEIVWVAAEIDSKMEASRELADFWCDRLEMVAVMCGFPRFKLWIISPEGFQPDAVAALRERNAFGSSRRQIRFLRRFLEADHELRSPESADEYEVVVPMDDDSELIGAHTLEEIGRRHNISPKTINQIKTAMLEASINASEHSLSPDRRIRQKFRVEEDRIVVTISNRGLRLADRKPEDEGTEDDKESARRGWGLKLIEKLMDQVKIEHTDDGTSISMTKFLPGPEASAAAAGVENS